MHDPIFNTEDLVASMQSELSETLSEAQAVPCFERGRRSELVERVFRELIDTIGWLEIASDPDNGSHIDSRSCGEIAAAIRSAVSYHQEDHLHRKLSQLPLAYTYMLIVANQFDAIAEEGKRYDDYQERL